MSSVSIVKCYIDVIVLGFFITYLMSTPVPSEYGDIVRVTLLAEESNADRRVRRTADSNLPDHLSCGFPFRNANIVLRLKRSRLLPTVTSDASNAEAASRMSRDSAVYTDSSAGSAMIVKRINGEYSLAGSFVHHNKEWDLQPLSNHTGGNDQSRNESYHRIFPMNVKNTAISFVNDVVLDTEDRPEQLYAHKHIHNAEGRHQKSTNGPVTGSRHKRATTQHVIEIAFVADFEDYSKWKRHVGAENAVSAMRLWYTFTAESINIRFQTIKDPDFAISTTVTVLKILTNPTDATFISNLVNANGVFRGSDALNAFRKWLPKQSDVPLSDHYMLMTGYDVMGSSGIAISSRVCTQFSISICEDSFTGSLGGVAAHELGHSLSAVHDMDTSGPNACTDRDQYVMSSVFTSPVGPGNEGNPWRFSPCSIKSFKAHLEEVTCTLPEHTSGLNELPLPNESDRAGQVLFMNAQCVLAFRDSRSSFCNSIQVQNGGLGSLCGGMYCSIPNDLMGACQTVVPQEFTPCGTRKWCVTGRCVDMDDPSTTSTAPSAATTIRSTSSVTLGATSSVIAASPTSTQQTTIWEAIGIPEVPNILTAAPETTTTTTSITSTQVKSTATTPTTAPTSTTATTPTFERMSTPATVSTTLTPVELETTPRSTNSTPSGIPDVSMCNYLIYLRKGTEWWHCVQRALGRTETVPRPVIRLPVRRRRIYIRRFRFFS